MSQTIKVQLQDIIKYRPWKDNHKEPENHSPALDYCRKLLSEGKPYGTRLEVYRGEELAYFCSKIGKSSKWTIRENKKHGPEFKKYTHSPYNRTGRIDVV